MNSDLQVDIRPLKAMDEFHACEEIQSLVWGVGHEWVVPGHMLLSISKADGIVLGAFDADEQMVGFVMGLLALREASAPDTALAATLQHNSDMLGVRPNWWGRGVGYLLKLAQRETVLAQGLDLMTWTFDPLERSNATLNFAKLGVVCNTYLTNLYGEMRDSLNVGVASDRFQVEWWLRSERVERRLAGERPDLCAAHMIKAGVPLVNPATLGNDGLLRPTESRAALNSEQVLVEVPVDFQALKQGDLSLARAWRQATASIFQPSFARGYVALEYLHEDGRSYYLLEHRESLDGKTQ